MSEALMGDKASGMRAQRGTNAPMNAILRTPKGECYSCGRKEDEMHGAGCAFMPGAYGQPLMEHWAQTYSVRFIGDVQRMQLEPGDAIVITVPHRLAHEQARNIKNVVADKFPGHPVLVCGDGMTVAVFARKDLEAYRATDPQAQAVARAIDRT